jgi:hypothetical protein
LPRDKQKIGAESLTADRRERTKKYLISAEHSFYHRAEAAAVADFGFFEAAYDVFNAL